MVLPPPRFSQSSRGQLVLNSFQIQPGCRTAHAQRPSPIGNRYSLVAATDRRLSARKKEANQRNGEGYPRRFKRRQSQRAP